MITPPIDLTTLVAVLMGGTFALAAVGGMILYFAVRPMIEAAARARTMEHDTEAVRRLRARVAALEAVVGLGNEGYDAASTGRDRAY